MPIYELSTRSLYKSLILFMNPSLTESTHNYLRQIQKPLPDGVSNGKNGLMLALRNTETEFESRIASGTMHIGNEPVTYGFINPETEADKLQRSLRIKSDLASQNTPQNLKAVNAKIKEWAQNRDSLQEKKRRFAESVAKAESQISELEERKLQETEQRLYEERRKRLVRSLEEIQERKHQRESRIKESRVPTVEAPLFKQFEEEARKKAAKREEELRGFLESKKDQQKVDKEKLREHERNYIDTLKKKKVQRSGTYHTPEKEGKSLHLSDFQLVARDPSIIEGEQAKAKRRQAFQEKLAIVRENMKIKTIIKDESPGQETLHRLRRRAEANAKQLGDQYLKEMRMMERAKNLQAVSTGQQTPTLLGPEATSSQQLEAKTGELKGKGNSSIVMPPVQRSISLPSLPKPTYKNYLEQLKQARPSKPESEIDLIRRKMPDPIEANSYLVQLYNNYENLMLRKIKELKTSSSYQDSLEKEEQIDDVHSKALRIKLACIEIRSHK